MKQRVAVVGTGVAGLAAAFYLKDRCDVTLFEKESHAGGHAHTLHFDDKGHSFAIDTAFMVYNEVTYPMLTQFLKTLGVAIRNTDMSFSVQHCETDLEYCGTGLNGLFAQRRRLFSLRHWVLLKEIHRFNRTAHRIIADPSYETVTLEQFLQQERYTKDFIEKFLIPMGSAVWSTPWQKMLSFPAVTLIRFFRNHGFLGLRGHLQWKTLVGGAHRYVEKVLGFFHERVFLNNPIVSVDITDKSVELIDQKEKRWVFDKVVLACHADQALSLLAHPTPLQRDILTAFRYQRNPVVLHTDDSIMPKNKRVWSSWNYRITSKGATTVYWINRLQGISHQKIISSRLMNWVKLIRTRFCGDGTICILCLMSVL